MPYYLSFDGGGSKSWAILFGDKGPLGSGKSGGTNTSSAPLADVRQNIAACVAQALQGHEGITLDAVYTVIVGPRDVLIEEIRKLAQVRRTVHLGEGQAGLLAGALTPYGLLAQAGTGSDAFYCGPDGRRGVVGAAGPILGDDGGGAWIGQQAMRRAIAHEDGWGAPTSFLPLLCERWGLADKNALIHLVYDSPAPFRKVASAVPVVAEAARAGDSVCLSLFEEAGHLMAVQMLALMRREGLMDSAGLCVCCGGCWKAHPAMYATFARALGEPAPRLAVMKPRFEHVMAGVVAHVLERSPSRQPEAIERHLAAAYAAYAIQW